MTHRASPSPMEIRHKELARTSAAEGIVLLKNDGALPIQPCPIALFGMGAEYTTKGGTGSGEVNERHAVNIREGLENAGFTITTNSWLTRCRTVYTNAREYYDHSLITRYISRTKEGLINITSAAFALPCGPLISADDIRNSHADICIYVIARQAGEGSDRKAERGSYYLHEEEIANIKTCAASFAKTIIVINAGCSIDASLLNHIKGINAILYIGQCGMEGGNALADILIGKVTPSGRLTDTWVTSLHTIPFADDFARQKEEVYREGIYVGYRYFTSFHKTVQYPFGYGLSYTTFKTQFDDLVIDKDTVTIHCTITNTGHTYAGKHVIQLYCACPGVTLDREAHMLVAFAKTKKLSPQETETVQLSFSLYDLAAYDKTNAAWILEEGKYILFLGENAEQLTPCAAISLKSEITTIQFHNIYQNEKFETLKTREQVHDVTVPTWEIDPSSIPLVTHTEKENFSALAKEKLSSLSLNEMFHLVVGDGMESYKRRHALPGSCGCTTEMLYDKGIASISFADGPAGLRIDNTFAKTKKGKLVHSRKTSDKDQLYYQYATAWPCEIVLGATFNTKLMEEIGNAIGEEMEQFGCTFWLGPAVNIHRNPLCGRNYEYFSEDPLVSGKCAAAIIRGVESHKGCYAVIKHFAANNRETTRSLSNSIVDERTLREIYLKPFAIAIREGKPHGVMTSYNRLNGTYTANSYALCTTILRKEWGYQGVVMSDWFSIGLGHARHGAAIHAGNDLIMPGNKADIIMLKNDYQRGVFTKEELKTSCLRILDAILKSQRQKLSQK